jgi:predicted dehydrogenase
VRAWTSLDEALKDDAIDAVYHAKHSISRIGSGRGERTPVRRVSRSASRTAQRRWVSNVVHRLEVEDSAIALIDYESGHEGLWICAGTRVTDWVTELCRAKPAPGIAFCYQ